MEYPTLWGHDLINDHASLTVAGQHRNLTGIPPNLWRHPSQAITKGKQLFYRLCELYETNGAGAGYAGENPAAAQ